MVKPVNTQMNLCKIANIECMIKSPINDTVQCPLYTHNKCIKFSNTYCMIYLPVKYWIKLNVYISNSQQKVSV